MSSSGSSWHDEALICYVFLLYLWQCLLYKFYYSPKISHRYTQKYFEIPKYSHDSEKALLLLKFYTRFCVMVIDVEQNIIKVNYYRLIIDFCWIYLWCLIVINKIKGIEFCAWKYIRLIINSFKINILSLLPYERNLKK